MQSKEISSFSCPGTLVVEPHSGRTTPFQQEVLIQEFAPPWRDNIHSNALYAIFRFMFYRCWLCSFVYPQDLGEQEKKSAAFTAWTEGLSSHWKSLRHTNQHAMGYIPELETRVRRHFLFYCLRENHDRPEFFDGGKRIIGQEVVKLLGPSKIGKRMFFSAFVVFFFITKTYCTGHGG